MVVQQVCKGDESLEDEEHSSWPLEVDNDQLRAITGADPLRTTEVAKELNADHPMFIWHLKQIGKVKKLNKWVPHKVTANQKKKDHFELLSSLILPNNNKPCLNQIAMCNEKWIA